MNEVVFAIDIDAECAIGVLDLCAGFDFAFKLLYLFRAVRLMLPWCLPPD